jgi:DNA-binding LacI/PurR family transcriptional regulator
LHFVCLFLLVPTAVASGTPDEEVKSRRERRRRRMREEEEEEREEYLSTTYSSEDYRREFETWLECGIPNPGILVSRDLRRGGI